MSPAPPSPAALQYPASQHENAASQYNARWALAAGLAAAALAWIATSPPLMALVNWDQASYLGNYAVGKLTWSSPPWNAHFGIGHVYFLGCRAAGLLGGTAVDGFRFTNAVFFGLAAGLVADLCARLTGRGLLGALFALVWATSFVNAVFLLTVEDNVLYLPAAAAVIRRVTLKSESFSATDALWAGAAAGFGMMMSFQALLYLGPAIWVSLLSPGSARERAIRLVALLAAAVAVAAAWAVIVGLTSDLHVRDLLGSLFARPTGSFVVRSPTDVKPLLDALGIGALFLVVNQYPYGDSPTTTWMSRPTAGALFLALAVIAFAFASRRSLRTGRLRPHLVAASFAFFLVATPFYVDVDFRYLVRFDFVALLLVVAWATALEGAARRWQRASAASMAVLLAAQVASAGVWDARRHASYPTYAVYPDPLPLPAAYGREGQSWFQYFRGLRRAHPDACRFVFEHNELSASRWWFEIGAVLWSELPEHIVVGDPAVVRDWRMPPHEAAAKYVRENHLAEKCAWVSPAARALLAKPDPPPPAPLVIPAAAAAKKPTPPMPQPAPTTSAPSAARPATAPPAAHPAPAR